MKLFSTIGGAMIGSLAMYLFDPDRGRARRAAARDRTNHEIRSKQHAVEVMKRDFGQRVRGMRHELVARMSPDRAGDEIIERRVCSALGHVCTHPHSLQVSVRHGVVQLSGPVLADEAQLVLRTVRMVRGVSEIHNLTTVHQSEAEVPEFQDIDRRVQRRRTPPAQSFVMLCGGGLLGLYGIARRGIVGNLCCLVGAGMAARSIMSFEGRANSTTRTWNGPSDTPAEALPESANA